MLLCDWFSTATDSHPPLWTGCCTCAFKTEPRVVRELIYQEVKAHEEVVSVTLSLLIHSVHMFHDEILTLRQNPP